MMSLYSLISIDNFHGQFILQSYLDIVEICTTEPSHGNEGEVPSSQTAEPEKSIQTSSCLNNAVDVENDAMDVDSEQDAKGEDQTEEDATEASGLLILFSSVP